MFFQKCGITVLALAASGLCLISSGVLAQESSPYVGNSERARINEAMVEEEALIKETASSLSSSSLTINPFPVTSPAQNTKTEEKQVPPARQPVAAPVERAENAPSSPPPEVEEGFEIIDLTVVEQPEENLMPALESAEDEGMQEEAHASGVSADVPGQDTFDVSIQSAPVTARAETGIEDAGEPIDPDLLVIPPALYEKRMTPEALPRPVKITRENNKTVEVQSGKVMSGTSQITTKSELVQAPALAPQPIQEQPAQEVAAMPPVAASYEPPPEVADSGWQPDSAPQSIVGKEGAAFDIQPPAQEVHAQPARLSEKVNWIDPPPIKRWRALRGTTLQEQLAMWARAGGMRFIWDTNRTFIVKETFSMQASYEQALSSLLAQYEGDNFRPFGKAYIDDVSGQRVVVIRSVD